MIALFLVLKKDGKSDFRNIRSIIGIPFLLYILISIFTVIPSFFLFWGTIYSETPIKGLAMLFATMLVPLATIKYRYELLSILNGFVFGILANIFYSLLCYILFQLGIKWRVIDYFGSDGIAFFNYSEFYYRVQGFFLECSHFMVFIAASLPLLLYKIKSDVGKSSIVLVIAFLSVISFTGNVTNLFLSLFLYFFFVEKKYFSLKRIFYLSVIIICLTFVFRQNISDFLLSSNFYEMFDESIKDVDLTDSENSSNVIRSTGMENTIKLIKENPFGVGYGCGAPLLELTYRANYAQSTYSFLLRVLLESGWIGFSFYLIASVRLIINLYRCSTPLAMVLMISYICLTVGQTANGIGWVSHASFLFVICSLYTYNSKLFIRFENIR